ncbi:MAG: xanthine dehydrogenase family protein subunit M [Desulfobacterales bacterium]|nr:MAG: xanthine dehydrogenase family protein subunit M [Desulfobacterales bacterium]
MIPIQFDYATPKSLDEAIALLHQTEDACALAGGHDLLTQLKLRRRTPKLVVHLGHIPDLRGIRYRPDEDALYIGAMVTCSELVAHPEVQNWEALVEAANSIGDAQVRNCATLGGNLAGGDPTTDLPAAALALEVALHVVGPHGPRVIAADQFFVGPFDTALEAGEIIKELKFPATPAQSGSAYEKIKNPANSHPICGVAAAVTLTKEGKLVAKCRVAVTGAAEHPARLHEVEAALEGTNPTSAKIAEAAGHADRDVTFVSDLSASGEYRADLATVLTERVLIRAVEMAREG